MRYSDFAYMNLLQDAYHCYRRNNLIRSQATFSRRILGQKPSYYSSMIARDRTPSHRVMETLLNVTKTILATFIANPHFGKSYAENLNNAYKDLKDLTQKIAALLEPIEVVENVSNYINNSDHT